MKIGFIGLGNMGRGMARNLLRAGHQVHAYNRTPAKASELEKEGATAAASPAKAAAGADAVCTMLSNDSALRDVVFGAGGLAEGLAEGAVHISCSTVSTALARELEHEHEKRHQGFISAPVFGRPDAAENKKLVVVAAGDSRVIERFRPVLDDLGRATFAAGDRPWQANAVKLCGNFMIASMIETFGEAFAALRKSGVEPARFLEIMNELFASPVYKNYGSIAVERKFDPAAFTLSLGLKDIRLVLDLAHEASAPMPIASLLRDHFLSAMAHGQEQLDWSSLVSVSARNAGLDQ